MKFIKKILIEDEEIIKEIKLDIYQYIGPFFILTLGIAIAVLSLAIPSPDLQALSLGFGVLITFTGVYKYLLLKSVERAVTNFRVIEKRGLFNTNQNEIKFSSMETAEIKQTIIDKMVGTGSVEMTATGGADLIIKDIDNPYEALKAINTIHMSR